MENMRNVVLPEIFTPKLCNLVRMGSDFDGGYLLPPSLVYNCEELLSLGANYDVKFEKELFHERQIKTVIVDLSVRPALLLKSSLKSLLLGRLKDAGRYAFSILDQWALGFRHREFEFKYAFVGSLEKQISLGELISSHLTSDKILISCDIEGHEYRILNEILALQSRISGLVIEFHDCDIHRDKIENFINEFELDICHVHVNNCGPITKDAFPTTLEITFSRYIDFAGKSSQSPHLLDAPCDPKFEDIAIRFLAENNTKNKTR